VVADGSRRRLIAGEGGEEELGGELFNQRSEEASQLAVAWRRPVRVDFLSPFYLHTNSNTQYVFYLANPFALLIRIPTITPDRSGASSGRAASTEAGHPEAELPAHRAESAQLYRLCSQEVVRIAQFHGLRCRFITLEVTESILAPPPSVCLLPLPYLSALRRGEAICPENHSRESALRRGGEWEGSFICTLFFMAG